MLCSVCNMKRRGAAQGSEGEFGKFSIPNPPMYSTIMLATIMSPLRGSDVVGTIVFYNTTTPTGFRCREL